MKTFLLLVAILILIACEKESETPQKIRYMVKYEVNCSTSGFDVIYSNAICKVEKKFIATTHWDTTFMNISSDSLALGATPKNIKSKISGEIDYNDFMVNSMTIDNIDKGMKFCFITCGYVIK